MKDLFNDYDIFSLFRNKWALVTAGNIEHFNTCTIGWGSMGTIWTRGGKGETVTVYVHPSRYTCQFLQNNEYFTVSFYSEEYRKALGYLGSHSGRDGDKITPSGLTAEAVGESVSFKEAEVTILCRKICQQQLVREGLAEEIKQYYEGKPGSFPPDENGQWQPHWMFMGEVMEIIK